MTKPARKRSAAVIASSESLGRRLKVRVQVKGKRVWVQPENAEACRAALTAAYGSRRKWTESTWAKLFVQEVQKQEGCGLRGNWGGARKRMPPVQESKQPVARELPCVDQQPVDLAQVCTAEEPEQNGSSSAAGGADLQLSTQVAVDEIDQQLTQRLQHLDPDSVAQLSPPDNRLTIHRQPVAPGLPGDEGTRAASLKSLLLQERLGSGTFGDVFKCSWNGLSLAVKIRNHRNRKRVGEDNEISILKHVFKNGGHPSIIRLEAWRSASDMLYLFFQACDTNLRNVLSDCASRNEALSARDASCVARPMCSALAYLQSSHVIHRDFKPANILLRRKASRGDAPSAEVASSGRWSPVLCDFGNAKVASRAPPSVRQWPARGGPLLELGAATRRVTTLWYAAPEMLVFRGRYSFGVDVWALGLVLAEMENNRHVCPTKAGASEWEQLLEAWIMRQPVATSSPFVEFAQTDLLRYCPLRALGPKLRRAALGRVYGARFRAFAARCLQFDPAQRATALALAREYHSDYCEAVWP